MRLDRFLSLNGFGSRRSVKKYLRNRKVTVNGNPVSIYDTEIHGTDKIEVNGKEIPNVPFMVLRINKPKGYRCSRIDENYPSVRNLIPERYRKRLRRVGRLDQDTTGLLLLTDNGVLNARLSSPKTGVEKTYYVTVNHLLRPTLPALFDQEVDIGRGEVAAPSKLEIIDDYHAYLTVHEGKYHEVKRLFGHYNYDVTELKRVRFGPISLGELERNKTRLLTNEERNALLESCHRKKEDQL